ncbi:MAG: hypothetical protein WCH65_03540 [bacterium]
MMEEQKQSENIQATTSIPGSSGPDFSNMGNLKLNDLDTTPVASNLISQINAEEKTLPAKEEVHLENLGIQIQNTQESAPSKILFGESGVIGQTKSKYHDQYRKLFLISFFIIIITGSASILLRLYSSYIYFASQAIPDTTYETYISAYKQGQQFVDNLLHLSDYQQYIGLSLVGSGESANIDKVILDKNLSYIQKKDILQQAVNGFSPTFISNSQKLTTLKEDVSKYGFFSEELYDLLENQTYSTSIKKYLLSLEIIKFSSAIKVFGYLDTFVSSLATSLNISTSQVETNMQNLAERGEKDILVYLNNCYLNPYEIDYDCNLVGDFDRYYALVDKEKTPIDTNFFKKMMQYVDNKLEQTDLPSFSITFKKYDPTQKQISFTVDVNTFKQDELALIKK